MDCLLQSLFFIASMFQVLYIQAFVLVFLLGKFMRKVFFGQLRAAEMEVKLMFVFLHLPDYGLRWLIWSIITDSLIKFLSVTWLKMNLINGWIICIICVLLIYVGLFSLPAPHRALLVRCDWDLSGLHCVQRRFLSAFCCTFHPATLFEVLPLARRGPCRLCEWHLFFLSPLMVNSK